jgi:hypothetical protein
MDIYEGARRAAICRYSETSDLRAQLRLLMPPVFLIELSLKTFRHPRVRAIIGSSCTAGTVLRRRRRRRRRRARLPMVYRGGFSTPKRSPRRAGIAFSVVSRQRPGPHRCVRGECSCHRDRGYRETRRSGTSSSSSGFATAAARLFPTWHISPRGLPQIYHCQAPRFLH